MRTNHHEETYRPVRPWFRFGPRNLDLSLSATVCGLLWDAIGPPVGTKYLVNCMLYVFIWVPVEAVLLSTWGTTPGKWLLRITVRDSSGHKLKFSAAFNRSLYVWAWGLGIGYPYAAAVAEAFAYRDVRDKGMTRWDIQGNIRASHNRIGTHRAVLTMTFLASLVATLELSTEFVSSPSASAMVIVGTVWIVFAVSLFSLVALTAEGEK